MIPSLEGKSVQDSEAETILSVERSNSEAHVITTGCWGLPLRFRYGATVAKDTWQITGIEGECGVCHGSGRSVDGKSNCEHCKSKGWFRLGEKRD